MVVDLHATGRPYPQHLRKCCLISGVGQLAGNGHHHDGAITNKFRIEGDGSLRTALTQRNPALVPHQHRAAADLQLRLCIRFPPEAVYGRCREPGAGRPSINSSAAPGPSTGQHRASPPSKCTLYHLLSIGRRKGALEGVLDFRGELTEAAAAACYHAGWRREV